MAKIWVDMASQGNKVLVIDFDLEAPGLDSLFPSPSETLGLANYVKEYQETSIAPDFTEYCYQYPDEALHQGSLWVMPAYGTKESHSSVFRGIDWRKLYDEQRGYLLMEDLKAQWKEILQADYVFIDSRTGHTDVEGICTRQLPDVLAILFVPNSQNLRGLKDVVGRVDEFVSTSQRKISKLFVASNVPDLDDEHAQLSNKLSEFSGELGYKQLDGTVHHYPSLSLLDDALFVKSRPRSQLSMELNALSEKIRSFNFEDVNTVLAFLNDALREYRVPHASNRIKEKLNEIIKNHSDNALVMYKLGVWFDRRGEISEAMAAIQMSIDLDQSTAEPLLRLARLSAQSGDYESALDKVNRALDAEDVTGNDFLQIVSLSEMYQLDVLNRIPNCPALLKQSSEAVSELVEALSTTEERLDVAKRVLDQFRELDIFEEKFVHVATLVEIGLRNFDTAIRLLPPRADVLTNKSNVDLFNLAMAEWGRDGQPPLDIFEALVRVAREPGVMGVNYDQCLALACFFGKQYDLGRSYADSAIDQYHRFARSAFSCWSYLYLEGEILERELRSVRELFDGNGDLASPAVFRTALLQY